MVCWLFLSSSLCFLITSGWQKWAAQLCSQDIGGMKQFLFQRKLECSLSITNTHSLFQSSRFLYTGSLHATCVIFQVMTPKWGESTFPPFLLYANPNTWLYLGIKDPWDWTVGKFPVNVAQTHWWFSVVLQLQSKHQLPSQTPLIREPQSGEMPLERRRMLCTNK